jgi:hypothetical protein
LRAGRALRSSYFQLVDSRGWNRPYGTERALLDATGPRIADLIIRQTEVRILPGPSRVRLYAVLCRTSWARGSEFLLRGAVVWRAASAPCPPGHLTPKQADEMLQTILDEMQIPRLSGEIL